MSTNNSPEHSDTPTERKPPPRLAKAPEERPVIAPKPEEVPYGIGGAFVSIGGGRRVRVIASK